MANEVKGPILGTQLLAGVTPSGAPGIINGTVLAAGVGSDGQPRWLAVDGSGNLSGGSSGGAPTGAQYVVGAAHADLSAELVLGTAVIMAGLASALPAASLAGRLYYETDTNKLKRDNGSAWVVVGSQDIVVVQDQKASGTAGGTFTTGDWRTRVLNTEVVDTGGIASLASNQITLPAGTYECMCTAPAHQVQVHQLRIQDITAGTTLLLGANCYTTDSVNVSFPATVFGVFVLSAQSAIEVQHRCGFTVATIGFGVATSWGTEVYTTIMLRKIA